MPPRSSNKPDRTSPARVPRADVQRNHAKLLAAAETMFAEHGADASMDEIARRARVGIATLYRHFPTREVLLAAACDERLLAIADAGRRAAESGSPKPAAVERFLADLVRYAGMYRGFAASLGVVLQSGTPGCHATSEVGQLLVDRGRAAGELRPDVEFDDVICIATAISLAVANHPSDGHRVGRLVGMFIQGLRATNGSPRSRVARPSARAVRSRRK